MLETGWWPKLFAQMETGDEKLWIDVFVKGSVLMVGIMLSKADRNEEEGCLHVWVRVPAEFCFS